MLKHEPDRLLRIKAQRQADAIVAYWGERGKSVKAWIECIAGSPNAKYKRNLYCVRSTLVNGMPSPYPTATVQEGTELLRSLRQLKPAD